MQDWASISGARRRLPTNVPDGGAHVNVNIIRCVQASNAESPVSQWDSRSGLHAMNPLARHRGVVTEAVVEAAQALS